MKKRRKKLKKKMCIKYCTSKLAYGVRIFSKPPAMLAGVVMRVRLISAQFLILQSDFIDWVLLTSLQCLILQSDVLAMVSLNSSLSCVTFPTIDRCHLPDDLHPVHA
jgi:hypothetical protein